MTTTPVEAIAHAQDKPTFRQFIEAHIPSIADEIVDRAMATMEVYRSFPRDLLVQSTIGSLIRYLDGSAPEGREEYIRWSHEQLQLYEAGGISLEASFQSISLYRVALVNVCIQAVTLGIVNAVEGFQQLMEVFDISTLVVAQYFQGRLSVALNQVEEQATRFKIFHSLAENAPDGIIVADLAGTITYTNAAVQTMTGYADTAVGLTTQEFYHDDAMSVEQIAEQLQASGSWNREFTFQRRDGRSFPALLSMFRITANDGTPLAWAGILRDNTQRFEQERLAVQERIIEYQQAAIRELSTPLMPIADDVVVMPIVGNVDSTRAQQIMETLLEGVAEHRAEVSILDITGVRVVDTQVANALLQAARAVKLLGAKVVLTGISPEIAQTLVSLGTDLSELVMRSSLQRGIAYALEHRKRLSLR